MSEIDGVSYCVGDCVAAEASVAIELSPFHVLGLDDVELSLPILSLEDDGLGLAVQVDVQRRGELAHHRLLLHDNCLDRE